MLPLPCALRKQGRLTRCGFDVLTGSVLKTTWDILSLFHSLRTHESLRPELVSERAPEMLMRTLQRFSFEVKINIFP